VQWLSDNGSVFAAYKTIDIAVALNLVPCFTPVESPESNGMAEAFVKTLKRDYVRVSPSPNAASALNLIDSWTTTPCTRIPVSATARLGNTSCSQLNPPRVRSNGLNSKTALLHCSDEVPGRMKSADGRGLLGPAIWVAGFSQLFARQQSQSRRVRFNRLIML
jgi:hypothetical protein